MANGSHLWYADDNMMNYRCSQNHQKKNGSADDTQTHIGGLVQDCSISLSNALEIRQYFINPSICSIKDSGENRSQLRNTHDRIYLTRIAYVQRCITTIHDNDNDTELAYCSNKRIRNKIKPLQQWLWNRPWVKAIWWSTKCYHTFHLRQFCPYTVANFCYWPDDIGWPWRWRQRRKTDS